MLISRFAYIAMVGGLVVLLMTHNVFSPNPVIIVLQTAAFALMIWARITFGRRSYHVSANPTAGQLVTNGPFRYIRNPIYAAVCIFAFAGAFSHLSWLSGSLALLILAGTLVRIFSEEKFLRAQYPEYAAYAGKTSRLIPFVF
jgi:protein-S-isoprenylcysteine O-methyltransferase Ste14